MPAGRLQISTSSTHDGGPIQAIGYINDTLKLAQDNSRETQPGDPPTHRRRRHLPRPVQHHPPRRRGPGRAARRMGRGPPLPRARGPGPCPSRRHHPRGGDRARAPGPHSL